MRLRIPGWLVVCGGAAGVLLGAAAVMAAAGDGAKPDPLMERLGAELEYSMKNLAAPAEIRVRLRILPCHNHPKYPSEFM